MAVESSKSTSTSNNKSADSYIGSLISLTSKSEIRYEGVLFNINTEESSIGLRNVRSFGTEGRKKDGPQIPPSDKVYDYILFRRSDIKDLQVKSSPPVQATPAIHNDPAIIQSQYSRPASVSASLPSVGSGTVADVSSHTSLLGLPRPAFQGGLPLYQPGPGGSLGSWASSPTPPNANASALPMPMYWQGFYGPSSGLSNLPQQPMLRPGGPPSDLPVANSVLQPMQYPSMNASLPTAVPNLSDVPSLLPSLSSTLNLTSSTLSSTLPSGQAAGLTPDTPPPSLLGNKVPTTSIPLSTSSSNLSLMPPLISSSLDNNSPIAPASVSSSKPRTIPGPILSYPSLSSHSVPDIGGPSTSSRNETSAPSLVTPDQLLQPAPTNLSSSQPLQLGKDAEVVQVAPSEASTPTLIDSKEEPLLPLPTTNQKMNGATVHVRYNNITRGRGRGRGNGILCPVTKFTEDFDFTAMNEKFNKGEVWGHLGKNNVQSRDKEDENDDADDTEEDDVESSKVKIKPVYVKDDFFDSLSCNSLDREPKNGRTKFSEQMKIDTETFGDFVRYHGRGGRGPGRGGRGPGRGGRSRVGHYRRGYGYGGRGRGQNYYNLSN